jgi:hypothetical protein
MQQTMFQQTDGAHLVVHCGLGIGLAAGKCCTERIREQGGDFSLERIGDGVVVKTGKISFDDSKRCALSARDKKSQRKHLPACLAWPESKQVTIKLQTHNPASHQPCERLVELQRSQQLPRACLADVVAAKGATKAAMGKCEH